VKCKEELKTRHETYRRELNEEPVVFRWKYKQETLWSFRRIVTFLYE